MIMCYIPHGIYNDICNLRSHLRTLIHAPTDNENNFTKRLQIFKNFRTIITFTCSRAMFLTLFSF